MWRIGFFLLWIASCYGQTADEVYNSVKEVVWQFDESYQLIEIDAPEGFAQDVKWAAAWIGTGLQQYCYHMLHFPGMRNLGIYIGEKLGATPIPDSYFHCNIGSVGEKRESSAIVGVWINGLNTNLKETILAAEFISEACGEIKVYYAYNSTSGLMADIWEHLLGKLYFPTSALEVAVEAIQAAIQEAGGIDSSGKVVIFAHSQGGAILERALQYLSSKEKKMLCIYTFGSAALFFQTPDIQVQHIVSDRDYIPFIADPVRYVIVQRWAPDIIHVKHGPTWGTFANHAFLGDTYQKEVLRIGKSLK